VERLGEGDDVGDEFVGVAGVVDWVGDVVVFQAGGSGWARAAGWEWGRDFACDGGCVWGVEA